MVDPITRLVAVVFDKRNASSMEISQLLGGSMGTKTRLNTTALTNLRVCKGSIIFNADDSTHAAK